MKTTEISATAVQHTTSGMFLYDSEWVVDLPEEWDPTLFNPIEDIEYKGCCSQGIIDTNYFSPEDFDKENWDDDDDTTDDYEEVELSREIDGELYIVEYHNFKPDYSLSGHRGGYCTWARIFDNLEDAESFAEGLSDRYRYTIIGNE